MVVEISYVCSASVLQSSLDLSSALVVSVIALFRSAPQWPSAVTVASQCHSRARMKKARGETDDDSLDSEALKGDGRGGIHKGYVTRA